jgi:hypothetical protein
VILDTKGNIFGGFTPVEWESKGGYKADDSRKSFLFTLKNPHNIPARKFALKAERKQKAIFHHSNMGPCFGSGDNIYVYENCNTNDNSYAWLGYCYTNDTGLHELIALTGSRNFQAKEIEVFEITAQTALRLSTEIESFFSLQHIFLRGVCGRLRLTGVCSVPTSWRTDLISHDGPKFQRIWI